jgi:hypothetical protein
MSRRGLLPLEDIARSAKENQSVVLKGRERKKEASEDNDYLSSLLSRNRGVCSSLAAAVLSATCPS